MSDPSSWIKAVEPCLRRVGESGRLFPNGKRVEFVFTVKAGNFLLLRTEGPGDINEATLPESKLSVPVIQPQKMMAVVRRRMLHALRMFRDAGGELRPYMEKAKALGFKKAEEHLANGWNCTIQPPLAQTGERATDLGMDGYCPSCTVFGVALTASQYTKAGGNMSIGVKTRVHFDPAFATSRAVQPETHNKVTEGNMSTTGGALFTDVHVMPGTLFIGRAVLHDVTMPELLATLYSLVTVEEIGGRSGVYGTVKIEPIGIRCGEYSTVSALEMADEVVKNGLDTPSRIMEHLKQRLRAPGFTLVPQGGLLELVKPSDRNGVFKELWESSIDYVTQLDSVVVSLQGGGGERGSRRSRGSR